MPWWVWANSMWIWPRRRASQRASTAVRGVVHEGDLLLDRAIKLFDAVDAPLTIASNSASTCYLLGYAQVQLYETSVFRRDKGLIASALKNSERLPGARQISCENRASNREYQGRSTGRQNPVGTLRRTGDHRHGVFCFGLAQFALVIGRPVHAQDIMLNSRHRLQARKQRDYQMICCTSSSRSKTFRVRTGEETRSERKELIGSGNSQFSTSLIELPSAKRANRGSSQSTSAPTLS